MAKPISAPKWRLHTFNNQVFRLEHLHPFRMQITVPATERDMQKQVSIHVSFSLHCFTKKTDIGSPALWGYYSDNRESRLFDSARWELSKKLRPIIESLDTRACYRTTREEFLTAEILENGIITTYLIFFTVGRSHQNKPSDTDLWLYINSAYVRPLLNSHKQNKRIKFTTLISNALKNL